MVMPIILYQDTWYATRGLLQSKVEACYKKQSQNPLTNG